LKARIVLNDQVPTELNLRESEQQFRMLANAIPQLCWWADADGGIVWYNQRWYEFTGSTSKEMEGWGWQSVHDPTELPKVLERWGGCIQRGEPFEMVFPLRRYDGVFVAFLTRVMPVKDEHGKVLRWFGTNTDISTQIKAESELRTNKDLLEMFVKNAPVALAMLDHNMRYLRTSDRWLTDHGINDKTILGRSHYDVFPSLPEHWKEAHRRGLAGESLKDEEQWTALDGDRHTIRWAIHPWGDSGSESGGIVISLDDITAYKQMETAMRTSRERLASIVDSAMDAIIAVDQEQRIVTFNVAAEKAFGYNASEVLGQPLDLLIPQRFNEAHRSHVVQFGKSGVSGRSMHSPGVLVARRKDDVEFPIEATISKAEIDGQQLFTVILRDISRRKQTEEMLIRSEKLATVGRLTATIAHEINNPLGAVRDLLYLIKNDPSVTSETQGYIEMAELEIQHARQIANGTLGLYKDTALVTTFRPVEILEQVLELFESKLKGRPVTVEKVIVSDRLEITGIAGEMRQVFWNLLNNAIDAIKGKGRIRVKITKSHDWSQPSVWGARVSIADTGSGIPIAAQQNIFEPFFTTKDTGTGLGLWVTSEILRRHAGSIKMRSRNSPTKHWTVFSVFIPENGYPSQPAVNTSIRNSLAQ
jgi:PAS domain S-box-containing protein